MKLQSQLARPSEDRTLFLERARVCRRDFQIPRTILQARLLEALCLNNPVTFGGRAYLSEDLTQSGIASQALAGVGSAENSAYVGHAHSLEDVVRYALVPS